MNHRAWPFVHRQQVLMLLCVVALTGACTNGSADEKGETVYEVVDPPASTGPSAKPTIDLPGFVAPGPTDPWLVTLLAMGDRTGPVTGSRLVSQSTSTPDGGEPACTPGGTCGYVGLLTISALFR